MKLKKVAIAGIMVLVSNLAFADHDHNHSCNKGNFDKANWQEHHLEHFEKHQEKLHTMLQLNTQQENAWKIYQGQIKPQANIEHPDFEELSKLNTLQRLDKMQAWDKERDNQAAERSKAIRSFYAQLNDAQKKVFDENAFPVHHAHKHVE